MTNFNIGIIVQLMNKDIEFTEIVSSLELNLCQIQCWNPNLYTKKISQEVKKRAYEAGVKIASLWAGWTGEAIWDFISGPSTLGIVPQKTRYQRVKELKQGAIFASNIGVPAIITHLGFIPENPSDSIYISVVETVRDIAQYCNNLGLGFWFETGQETPVTLLRLIEDVAMPNLGINLDPANLILYGKANPLDALDVFGKYVRSLHAKDALYPTNGRELGKEMRLGDGKVNFPRLLKKLIKINFAGDIIIEREIVGERQKQDIIYAREYLSKYIDGFKTKSETEQV